MNIFKMKNLYNLNLFVFLYVRCMTRAKMVIYRRMFNKINGRPESKKSACPRFIINNIFKMATYLFCSAFSSQGTELKIQQRPCTLGLGQIITQVSNSIL